MARTRTGPVCAVLQCFGLLLCAACVDPVPAQRSVLLVTFDTTRADRIGAYGHAGAATPAWDALASEGIRFESVLAPAPITLPSHASILTGLSPAQHGVRDNALYSLSDDAELVSERLFEAGWRTGAFLGSFVLDARFGLDQGFEVYEGPGEQERRGERSATQVVDAAIGWLETLPADARFFAWVHFFDPHEPFFVPDTFRSPAEGSYDRQIAYADAELGRLLEYLKRHERSLSIVATADHGESLGEHAEESHGVFLYQSTLRVPLVVAGAGLAARGAVATPLVGLVDVAPTLLTLAGLTNEAEGFGRSLLAADGRLRDPLPDRAYAIESWLPYHAFRWRALRGVVVGDHKLIEGARAELYDLARDPGERKDLSESEPERLRQLRERRVALERAATGTGLARSREVAPAERELLEALGYAVGTAADAPFAAELPDPAARIGDVALISEADGYLTRAMKRSRRRGVARPDLLTRARDAFERLRERNPRDPHLSYGLGLSEYGLGNHEQAVRWLERAVVEHPNRADVPEVLAQCYVALGREADAERVRSQVGAGATPPPDFEPLAAPPE